MGLLNIAIGCVDRTANTGYPSLFDPIQSENITTNAASSTAMAGTVPANIPGQQLACRLVASVDTYIAIGPNPTAAVGNVLLKANVPDNFKVRPGDKIAGRDL